MFVGCSGWSFEDWIGRFYPVNLAKKKEEWLRYYSYYFNTVEINSTFYGQPDDFIVKGWIKKAGALKGLELSVKVPHAITHEALARNDGDRAGVLASSFEATCVRPLYENGLLGAVLLQLSPFFRNDDASREALQKTLGALDTTKYRYAVEFRHRSWFDEDQGRVEARAFELLASKNVANTIVDSTDRPMVRERSADHAYFRFHGRDRDNWSDEEREEDLRLSRSDYLYPEDVLKELAANVAQISKDRSQVRVYFNNNGKAKGARNALQLMDLLGIPHREKDIPVQDQTTLGTFLMARR